MSTTATTSSWPWALGPGPLLHSQQQTHSPRSTSLPFSEGTSCPPSILTCEAPQALNLLSPPVVKSTVAGSSLHRLLLGGRLWWRVTAGAFPPDSWTSLFLVYPSLRLDFSNPQLTPTMCKINSPLSSDDVVRFKGIGIHGKEGA